MMLSLGPLDLWKSMYLYDMCYLTAKGYLGLNLNNQKSDIPVSYTFSEF